MKKIIAALTAFLFVFTFSACNGGDPDKGGKISIGAMNGATMLGLAKLNADVKAGEVSSGVEYTIKKETDPSAMTAGLANKTYDAAAVPSNTAAILCNNKDLDVKIAAVNTLNVLYLLSKGEDIEDFSDLKGKILYLPSTSQGNTPEYVVKYLLEKNGVQISASESNLGDKVFIKYDNPVLIQEGLKSVESPIKYAVLPQPAATAALMGNTAGTRQCLDLREEWRKIPGNENGEIVTGVLVVRSAYLVKNKATFDKFLEDYKASAEFMADTANLDTAAGYAVAEEIIGAVPVAKAALPKCGIVYKEGAEMKSLLEVFYGKLFALSPESLGGTIPAEGFYYSY